MMKWNKNVIAIIGKIVALLAAVLSITGVISSTGIIIWVMIGCAIFLLYIGRDQGDSDK